ncbi:ser arg-rich splicing protein [Cyclospora cayetanensis]|uniref:Ser arg-rich splicing protein n=1 Tax=Cyclospora cayetanensis TaxID=88456 RepID=A0A1D3D0K1_9EIME|nr:ser arg-rich splicing protein [Cyclospora cayetanensis]
MSESDGQQRMSLLVRNLSYQTSPEAVRNAFAVYGSVKDVYLPLDYHSRLPRGFGFVEFWHREDAERALEKMDGFELDGKAIEVAIAKKGRSAPQQMVRPPAETLSNEMSGDAGMSLPVVAATRMIGDTAEWIRPLVGDTAVENGGVVIIETEAGGELTTGEIAKGKTVDTAIEEVAAAIETIIETLGGAPGVGEGERFAG